MVKVEILKDRIRESGMKVTAIAEKSGILRETLYNRLNGVGDFTAREIVSLSKVLALTDADRDNIFLS